MKTLISVITYNEEKNIEKVIDDLQSNADYDIVVIDNGSQDNTVSICKNLGLRVISHCINSGSSFGTIKTYFLYAYHNNYDILCQFDGDGQHIAAELPKIIEPIRNGKADYVIGSRFLQNEGFQSYFFRRMGISLFAFLDSFLTGQKLTDVTSGFRAYGKKTIGLFAKYYRHELHDTSQLMLLSHYAGARIKEVPTKMKEREFGTSEFDFMHSASYTIKGLMNIIGCVLQKNQIEKINRTNHGI